MVDQRVRQLSIVHGSALALTFVVAASVAAACARPASQHCENGTICPPGKECSAGVCVSLSCGDGVLDPQLDEECDCGDDQVPRRPAGCTSPNDDRIGQCRLDCKRHCGDGIVDIEEDCDGAPPPGQSCITLGFDLGRLECTDLCMVSGGDGCSYLGWARLPRLTGGNLRSIWGASANDIYAVGWEGAVLHYDGTRWETELVDATGKPLYTTRFFTIWGRSSDGYVYIGGQNGTVLRRRAGETSWSAPMMLPQAMGNVNAIWGLPSSSRVVAVGDNGRIWMHDGTSWAVMHSGDLPVRDPSHDRAVDLHALWGTSIDNLYAVGDDFSIFHYNGSAWSIVESDGPSFNDSNDDWNAVWGSGVSDIYVAGDQGKLWHTTDGLWQTVTLPIVVGTAPLHGIWGTGASNIFVSGNDGTVLHYDGEHWLALRPTLPEHLYGFWGSSADNVYTIGNSGLLAHHAGLAWAMDGLVTTGALHDVWGAGPADILAVGDAGQVLRYQGHDWQLYPLIDATGTRIGASKTLRAIAGSKNGRIFIAGDDGTLARHDGVAWHDESIGSATIDLHGVWTDDSGQAAYAVGRLGSILRFDGTRWAPVTQNVATGTLNSVWGADADDVWVVGDYDDSRAQAVLLRVRGSSVEHVPLAVDQDLHRVWGTSATDVYVAGKDGELWHYDGKSWQTVDSTIAQDLHGLAGNSRGERFAAGSNGTAIYFDGQAWQQVRTGTFDNINAVWASDRAAVLVGDRGVIETLVFTAR